MKIKELYTSIESILEFWENETISIDGLTAELGEGYYLNGGDKTIFNHNHKVVSLSECFYSVYKSIQKIGKLL